jgi:hypothetical protein
MGGFQVASFRQKKNENKMFLDEIYGVNDRILIESINTLNAS